MCGEGDNIASNNIALHESLVMMMMSERIHIPTCMTLMLSPVSLASCSRMCLVGLGVAAKAALSVSSCLTLIVVRGPLLLAPTPAVISPPVDPSFPLSFSFSMLLLLALGVEL